MEGDDLKRVLEGLDRLEPPAPEAPVTPVEPEDAFTPEETPGAQPKLGPPGLAWGGQTNITLDTDDKGDLHRT
jgi:hypothetical protein